MIRAAEILHVPPWELLQQDAIWMNWALAAKHAENKAQDAQRKQADFRAKAKRKNAR